MASRWDAAAPAVVLPNGWTVTHCEGDAPLLCVTDGDRHVGLVELTAYPTDGTSVTLPERVEDFLGTMRDDRAAGCGADHRVPALPTTAAELGGEPAVHYGFDGRGADGIVHERVRGWMTQRGDTVWVVSANAYAPDGCLANEGGEFQPDDLAFIEDGLDGLVAATPLPQG